MSYHRALAIVEGLKDKYFIRFDYVDNADTSRKCVIGALFKAVGVVIMDPKRRDITEMVKRDKAGLLHNGLKHLDMSIEEAALLQDVNDIGEMTPEDRYYKVLDWLKGKCS